jgi:iron-sulfur cluster repair protein YtfE (RIC family)
MDMATQLIAMKQAGGRQLAQIAVLRKQHQMQQQLLDMIDEVTSKAPAPSGTGRVVDRHA